MPTRNSSINIPEMAPALVGQRVRLVREAAELSLRELAQLVGSDHSTISKIERGKRELSRDMGALMSVQLGIHLNYLFLGQREYLPTDPADRFFKLRHPA